MKDTNAITIGELAAVTGETIKTLRFWTGLGLLKAARGANNYRYYSGEAAVRAKFVRRVQALGFRLSDIARLLEVADTGGEGQCQQVRDELERQLAEVRSRIGLLQTLEVNLSDLLRAADARACDEATGCHFLPTSEHHYRGLTLP